MLDSRRTHRSNRPTPEHAGLEPARRPCAGRPGAARAGRPSRWDDCGVAGGRQRSGSTAAAGATPAAARPRPLALLRRHNTAGSTPAAAASPWPVRAGPGPGLELVRATASGKNSTGAKANRAVGGTWWGVSTLVRVLRMGRERGGGRWWGLGLAGCASPIQVNGPR